MKKIVMGAAALLCAASMFAVDFAAKVQMAGSIAKKNGDNVDFITLDKKDQKDADALVISASTDKAGANFQFWYTYCGGDAPTAKTTAKTKDETTTYTTAITPNSIIQVRSVKLWFKPIDQLKVTVGDVAFSPLYKERIFWWHGINGGAAVGSWGAFGGDYFAGAGLTADLSINSLSVTAALIPGFGKDDNGEIKPNAFVSTTPNYGYKSWGISAKYAFDGGSVGVAFADKGFNEAKTVSLGGEYTISGLYANVNLGARFGNSGFLSFSIDDYLEYSLDALKIQAHLPFVFTKSESTIVPGMYATVKLSYAIDGLTPYFLASTEPDGDSGWTLDNTFKFKMTFQPGVTFNVGAASFDIAFRADVDDSKEGNSKFEWKIPFSIGVGF